MNYYADEELDALLHYGKPRRSGRYPYGSGDNPYQHSGDFLSRVKELRSQKFTFTDENGKTWTGDNAIAKSMGLTTTQFRTQVALANDERRSIEVSQAKALREKGYSTNKIGEMMGKPESTVRSLLNEKSEARMKEAKNTADFLRDRVNEVGMIDVGTGVERELGVTKEKLNQALYMLEMEGYPTYGGGVPQVTNPGKQTNLKVLCPPGTEHKEIFNYENINSVKDYISYDGGETFKKSFVYPASMDSKRVKIRYAEEGGIEKDGLIEIRPGKEDLSLGNSHYAQVRILVDNDRYMKGMAVYGDPKDFPKGVDVIFNTNKSTDVTPRDVFKKIKDDPDNPFGSLIKEHGGQSYYIDKDGNEKLSLINKRAEEGDWNKWSDTLSAQFLSKQSEPLIKKQLSLAQADKQDEFDSICSLTNPTVKKSLLQSFADDCDAAAVHLKAAALPRQKYQVIMPVPSLKENEVYAPNYKDGESVALVRYPHGGTFEIPVLKVNNKHAESRKMLGNTPKDAIGINSKVAEVLSGADFDGDTVMVIPTGGRTNISHRRPLKDLEGFDPKMEYPERKGMKYMNNTQTEMGKVSNLITDMTLKGATDDELARAVKHSMVVIDAEKHKLDYKQSEIDNGISSLKKKYQGRYDEDGNYHEGASTLISRAKAETSVPKRQGTPTINPDGTLSYKTADDLYYTDKQTGKKIMRTQKSTQMAEVDDAYKLISDLNNPKEVAYADHANKMKSLANQARKEMINTGKIEYSSSAASTYMNEVNSLKSKLNVALKNAPRERQAQVMANAAVEAKKKSNPDMTKAEIKKAGQQELTRARNMVGAKREPIVITDKEWEAIQAGAISENKLKQIIDHTDIDNLRERAMPRKTTTLSDAKVNKINSMRASGYSTSEIAEAIGYSVSTVNKYLS